MKIYSVHELPGGSLDQTVFVKQGFSWPAFLFTIAWCLWHGLWVAAACSLVLFVAIGTLFSDAAAAGLMLVAALITGSWANDLRRRWLLATGYQETQLVPGRNLEEAELRYFASAETEVPSPPVTTKSTPGDHEPLGLFGTA